MVNQYDTPQERHEHILKLLGITNDVFKKDVNDQVKNIIELSKSYQKNGAVLGVPFFKKMFEINDEIERKNLTRLNEKNPFKIQCTNCTSAYCCHDWIGCSAEEVSIIKTYVIFKNIKLDIFRIAQLGKISKDDFYKLSFEDQKCPLLVNKKCSVYPVRPMICRNFYVGEGSNCKGNELKYFIPNVLGHAFNCAFYTLFPLTSLFKKLAE